MNLLAVVREEQMIAFVIIRIIRAPREILNELIFHRLNQNAKLAQHNFMRRSLAVKVSPVNLEIYLRRTTKRLEYVL